MFNVKITNTETQEEILNIDTNAIDAVYTTPDDHTGVLSAGRSTPIETAMRISQFDVIAKNHCKRSPRVKVAVDVIKATETNNNRPSDVLPFKDILRGFMREDKPEDEL